MQVINNKIRDDIVKKYAQYTKRVNGEMIKGRKSIVDLHIVEDRSKI